MLGHKGLKDTLSREDAILLLFLLQKHHHGLEIYIFYTRSWIGEIKANVPYIRRRSRDHFCNSEEKDQHTFWLLPNDDDDRTPKSTEEKTRVFPLKCVCYYFSWLQINVSVCFVCTGCSLLWCGDTLIVRWDISRSWTWGWHRIYLGSSGNRDSHALYYLEKRKKNAFGA